MRPRSLVLIALATVAGAFVAAALGFASDQVSPPVSELIPPKSTFQELPTWRLVECPRALIGSLKTQAPNRWVECGRLRTPESRGAWRKIELEVVRVRSFVRSNLAPLLLLPGGPGDAFIPALPDRLKYILPFSRDRELLFVDPRGTGGSAPRLDCPEQMRNREGLSRCFHKFHADLDPGAFSTAEQVSDLLALFNELKILRVAIYGVSYGSLVAVRFAQVHPLRVEGLILDSPIPAHVDLLSSVGKNAQTALKALLDSCVSQGECADPSALNLNELAATVKRLEDGSHSMTPLGRDFIRGISALMFSPTALAFLPHLITEARQGRFDDYERMVAGFGKSNLAFGVHLSVQCGEFLPLSSQKSIATSDQEVLQPLRTALSARQYLDFCREWKVPPASRSVLPPPTQPTLILSGRFDHLTPPSYAMAVASRLQDATLIIQENVGHGVAFGPCGAALVEAFLSEGSSGVNPSAGSCREMTPKVSFQNRRPTSTELDQMAEELRHRL